jgi:uncharacterized lipoprotein YmbA
MHSNRRIHSRVPGLIGLSGLIAVSACFSLARTEPVTRHYVLGGTPLAENPGPSPALAGVSIGVRRLRLASYLDPPFLAVRQEPHGLGFSEFNRWGEPLAGGINRAVSRYLASAATFRTVDLAPWPAREKYDYLIQLNVERFEGVAPAEATASAGEVHMLATWEVVDQQEGVVLARGTTEHREAGWTVGDYPDLVRSLDAGLITLSRDLLAAVESLATRTTSTTP